VLFIAYTFPPTGGAGVQRTTKFAKYLPHFGWDVSVLTVSNPSVPVVDESLVRDVPPATHVIRARTFEPSYSVKRSLAGDGPSRGFTAFLRKAARRTLLSLLQPDPQILWSGPAFRAAIRSLRQARHDAIVASAPPFSSLLLGAALSRYTKVPLVLDYRDEWSVSNAHWESRHLGRLSVRIQRRMEHYALRRAAIVVATSPRSAGALTELCRHARSAASVTHIYNGFDPDDFAGPAPPARPRASESWRLVYTGTLFSLTSPGPLVAAIEALAASEPAAARKIELVFAGRRTPDQDQLLQRVAPLCRLDTREYIPHDEAIALIRSADALCVLLSDLPEAGRVVPAKVFEYMASQKPILAVAPRGEVWDLLRSHPASFVCPTTGVSELRDWLVRSVNGGARWPEGARLDITPYNRRIQARSLADLLDATLSPEPAGKLISETATCSD
jgi:glycosyltransferase involved in cell wall biosynthesis